MATETVYKDPTACKRVTKVEGGQWTKIGLNWGTRICIVIEYKACDKIETI